MDGLNLNKQIILLYFTYLIKNAFCSLQKAFVE